MIVVKVELHSAITGDVTLLNSLVIDNVGGTKTKGNYRVRSYRKGLDPVQAVVRTEPCVRAASVLNHAREAESVLNLVCKALIAMGYVNAPT